MGGDHYAVVSDKASESGFFLFRIQIDTVSGDIKDIVNEGFRSSGEMNKDEEGIAFFPKDRYVMDIS